MLSLVQDLESFASSDALEDLLQVSGESEQLVRQHWMNMNPALGYSEVN